MVEQALTCTEVPLERLEAQICEGAAHVDAGTGRWLLLVGEFDRRKGYERWECRSTAFWLNWHCGVSVRTAREQVRVGRALLDYPRISEALCSGQISYSKTRAITRVVTPETEAVLLDLAAAVPASQIERVVAGRKRIDALATAAVHKARHLDTYSDEDGSEVGMFRVDPDEGALIRAALTLGKEILRGQKGSAEPSLADATGTELDDCSPESLRPKVSNADALVLMAETMLAADHHKDISRHERTLVVVHLDPDRAHLHEGPNLSTETAERLSCDACVCAVLMRDGTENLDLGRTQRLPNRAQRRALMVRDGGCRFPGCNERRYVEAHHVLHWTKGGKTDLANLLLLCWGHHHAVHEGGYRLAFEHGVVTVWRPDGTLLQSESLLAAEGPGIVEQNDALGLRITPESVASQWDGTPLTPETLSDTVAGLLRLEDCYRREVEAVAAPLAAAGPAHEEDTGYPDVIVIDDEGDEDFAIAEDSSTVVIADCA